jgi:DNA-directed RNA polymerase specialized sigma subunit
MSKRSQESEPRIRRKYGRRREFTEPENFFRLRYLGCMAHLSARNLDSALLDYGHNYNRERNSIVLDNLGLVYSTAIRFNPRSAPDKDDLVAEGTHSLIKAIDHFNPWRGYKFSTYATQSIINGLSPTQRNNETFKLISRRHSSRPRTRFLRRRSSPNA